jgi:ADP-ribosylglycohydrolase
MKDRFIGALLGCAIGDSMGMCVEELPFDEVILHYGGKITDLCEPHPSSPANFLTKGETTSEFEIVKIVAESLASKGRLDIKDIIERYLQWYEKEEIHNYVDPYFLVSLEAIKNGNDPKRGGSSIEGALPAIPIGMFHYTNPVLAVEGTKAVVMITHKNEIVLDTASILAVAIGELLQNKFYLEDEYEYFIELLKTFVSLEETKEYLDKVRLLVKENADYETAINVLGNGSFALEAVSQALFIFLKTPSSVEETIIRAVNSYGDFGGDTDAIALIAGAFSGAYNGEEAIPEKWKKSLKNYNEIVKLAEKLYNVALH